MNIHSKTHATRQLVMVSNPPLPALELEAFKEREALNHQMSAVKDGPVGAVNSVAKIVSDHPVAAKTVLGVVGGLAAVAALPVVLGAAGFTSAGVAAGSLAASLQTPLTVAGGWFATAQSVGAAGAATSTFVAAGAGGAIVGAFSGASSSEEKHQQARSKEYCVNIHSKVVVAANCVSTL